MALHPLEGRVAFVFEEPEFDVDRIIGRDVDQLERVETGSQSRGHIGLAERIEHNDGMPCPLRSRLGCQARVFALRVDNDAAPRPEAKVRNDRRGALASPRAGDRQHVAIVVVPDRCAIITPTKPDHSLTP